MATVLSRRVFLARMSALAGGALALAACQPTPTAAPAATEVPKAEEVATEAPAATPAAPSGEVVTLTFWKGPHLTAGQETTLCAGPTLEKFMAEYPNINVEFQEVPWSGYNEKFTAAFAAGQPPDVSYQTESFPTFVKAGNILPLDEFINESGFDRDYIFERAWKVAIYGGTTYGIPWRGAVSILYYNKELFEKAGLDPEVPPETMDEFLEYAKKLTGVEEDVYGFGVGPRDYHQNGQWNLRWGGAWFNDDLTRCVADSEESIAGFQFLADLFHVHKVAQPGAIAGQEPGTYGYFRDGKIGMTTQQPSLVTQIRNEKPEFKLGAAYVPKGPAPEPAGRACYSGVGMLAISKASKHAKEAWTLIQWLLTPEALRSWIGCLSAAVWAKVPLYEDDPVLSIVENARQYVFFWPYSEWVFKFWDLVTTYLEAIILGEMRVREGVTELVQKVNDILSESQV